MWKIGNEKLIQVSINKGMTGRKIILRFQGAILAKISISVHLAPPTALISLQGHFCPGLHLPLPAPCSYGKALQSISQPLKNPSHSRQNFESLLTRQSVPLPTRPQNRKCTLYLLWKDKGEVKRKIKTNGHSAANTPGCMQTR